MDATKLQVEVPHPVEGRAEKPMLEIWQDIGMRIAGKRSDQLAALSHIPQMDVSLVTAPSDDGIRALTTEQKAKVLLEVLDWKDPRSLEKWKTSPVYMKVLTSLCDVKNYDGDAKKRDEVLKQYGVGDLLAYNSLESLQMVEGKECAGWARSNYKQWEEIHEMIPYLPAATQFITDASLQAIYTTDKLDTLLGERFTLTSRRYGHEEGKIDAWWKDAYVAHVGFFNPRAQESFYKSIVTDQPRDDVIYKLLILASESRFMFRETDSSQSRAQLIDVLDPQVISAVEIARRAGISNNIDALLDYADLPAPPENEFWSPKEKYDNLEEVVQELFLTPPLLQRLRFMDALINQGVMGNEKTKTFSGLSSSLGELHQAWPQFIERCTDVSFGRSYKTVAEEIVFRREKYEAYKVAVKREIQIGEQMQALLQEYDLGSTLDLQTAELVLKLAQVDGGDEAHRELEMIQRAINGVTEIVAAHPSQLLKVDSYEDVPFGEVSNLGPQSDIRMAQYLQDAGIRNEKIISNTNFDAAPYSRLDLPTTLRLHTVLELYENANGSIPFEDLFLLKKLVSQRSSMGLTAVLLDNADAAQAREFIEGKIQTVRKFADDIKKLVPEDREIGDFFDQHMVFVDLLETYYAEVTDKVIERPSYETHKWEKFHEESENVLRGKSGGKSAYDVDRSFDGMFDTVVTAKILQRYVQIGGDVIRVTDAINPDLYKAANSGMQVFYAHGSDSLLYRDPDFQVPVSLEADDGATITITGPAGAGKSTAIKSVEHTLNLLNSTNSRIANPERLPATALPYARHVDLPEELARLRVFEPEVPTSDYEASLYTHFADSLAYYWANALLKPEQFRKEPFMPMFDEPGRGTNMYQAVALNMASRILLRELDPHIPYVISSHEGDTYYAAWKLLRMSGVDVPRNQTYGINPVTRQLVPDRVDVSLGIMAAEQVLGADPLVQIATAIKTYREAGQAYDINSFLEQYAGNEVLQEGQAHFVEREDLERFGFIAGDVTRGDFAYTLDALRKYGGEKGLAETVSYYSEIFCKLAQNGNPEELTPFIQAVASFEAMTLPVFTNNIGDIFRSAEIAAMPFRSFDMKKVAELYDTMSDPSELVRQVDKMSVLLLLMGKEKASVGEFRGHVKVMGEVLKQAAPELDSQVRTSAASWFVSSTLSFFESKAAMELLNPASPDHIDTLKIANDLTHGLYDSYIDAYNKVGGQPSAYIPEPLRKILSGTKTRTAADLEKSGGFLRWIAQSDGSQQTRENLAELSKFAQDNRSLKDSLEGSISINDLLGSDESKFHFAAVKDQMELLVFGAVHAGYSRADNPAGAVFSKPEEATEGDYPVSFEGGWDPGLRHSVEGRSGTYTLQNFALPDEHKKDEIVIETGPNGYGKSSIAQLQGKMAIYNLFGKVPAGHAWISSQIGGVVNSINTAVEQLDKGLSTFKSEATDLARDVRLAAQISAGGKKPIVIKDEPGLGINITESADLVAAWLGLMRKNNAWVNITTHNNLIMERMDVANRGRGDGGA